MGGWPDSVTARNELRAYVNDGAQDRPVKEKICIGPKNGTNTVFYTIDDRLVSTSFVPSVNYVDVAAGSFTVLDAVLGQFSITPAPPANSGIRARYYYQFFLDTDLDEALRLAAGEILESDDITLVPFGLKGCALDFGAHYAFTKQAIRWAQRMSEKFIAEDAPTQQDAQARPNHFKDLARGFYKTAVEKRLSQYERHGRRAAPAFGVFKPSIPKPYPIR